MGDSVVPKVSIVVPVYNVEKYIVKCLESLKQQTFHDIEIICIDDGSTDSSGYILDEFAESDDRFIVVHKNNAGYGHSVNMGISKAKGDYVGIVESDDFAKTDMIENLYNAAMISDADVIKGNYDFYFEKKEEHLCFNEILKECPYNFNFNACEKTQIFEVPASVWSALYKKSFLEEKNIAFLETPGASYQDVSFSFKVFMYAKSIYCIPQSVINYRFDNPDSSVHNSGKIFCICDEYKEIENVIDDTIALADKKNLYYQVMQLIKFRAYLWNFNRLAIPFQYYFLTRFSDEFKILYDKEKIDLSIWKTKDIEILHMIIEDKETFFSKYSKEYHNTDWENDYLLNASFEFDELNILIGKYNTIYIYGAGVIGSQTWEFLQRTCHKKKVKGFIVSDGEKKDITKKELPVKYLSEVEEKQALVLLAIRHNNRSSIIKLLVDRGFTNILVITDRMRRYM